MNLNFDIYAMIDPKTRQDRIALLEELLIEIENLNEALVNLLRTTEDLEQAIKKKNEN